MNHDKAEHLFPPGYVGDENHRAADVSQISNINETFEVENKAFIKSNTEDEDPNAAKKVNSFRTQTTNPFKNALMRKQTNSDFNQVDSNSVNDNTVNLNWKERLKNYLDSCLFGIKKFDRVKIYFGENAVQDKMYRFSKNVVKTTKYNWITWFPKSLLMQFLKAANVYFLLITVLTFMSFSPKKPESLVLTFSIVLFFTMMKEAYEDYRRYKQDKEVNFKKALVFKHSEGVWEKKFWADIEVGEMIKVVKDEQFPCDLLFLKSSSKNGIGFVDTMNLDGETNLKEKLVLKETQLLAEDQVPKIAGAIECDPPNEFLDFFEATFSSTGVENNKPIAGEIKQLLLRGTTLRNTQFIIGVSVYCGVQTKSFKNARKPPSKMSNVLRKMNKILYSVFAFEGCICLILSIASIVWETNNIVSHFYLGSSSGPALRDYIERIFVFIVAYSQLIPISLYVALEVLKLVQAYLIAFDDDIFYKELNKRANVKTSDLIEELGQVEFIFSDKTGTLTSNQMEFRKCSINGVIYGDKPLPKNQREKHEYHIGGDARASEKVNARGDPDGKAIYDFFKLLSVCHTVVPEPDSKDKSKIKYQASSPDELALVEGAAAMGFKFIDRSSDSVRVSVMGGEEEAWKTIAEFPFDSTRKRMSVLVKNPKTGSYMLMTKGADSIMIPRIKMTEKFKELLLSQLSAFAVEGLRTLVMAQRPIDDKTFHYFMNEYDAIKVSGDKQKEKKLSKIYEILENDLDFVGMSAIEDKLQEGVPETIFKLMDADIKVWVLTGDKQETAIEIGKSCKLIQESMDLKILSSPNKNVFKDLLKSLCKEFDIRLTEPIPPLYQLKNMVKRKMCIVIDGSTLAWVFGSDPLTKQFFFRLALLADSCICCRVSPKQKADVVKLAKSNGKWITLAIGDGANDVSMIMEAHLGIGIFGKEGTQAARSADFAIGQFRYLQKLLLVHGRWGYKRVSYFICYYFYKNCAMVFTELFFAFFNGFSGQIYFADWLPLMFNAFWTSWPCMANFALDQDVDCQMSLKHPKLYKAGPQSYYFNFKVFWVWMASAFWHGFVCFWLPVFACYGANLNDGTTNNHWWVSTISFCLLMHSITIKLFLETSFWNVYNIILGILSLILYYLTVLILSNDSVSYAFQPNINGVMFRILKNPKAMLILAFLPFVATAPDYVKFLYSKYNSPTPAEQVVKKTKKWAKSA